VEDINDKRSITRTAINPLDPEYIVTPSNLLNTLPQFEPSDEQIGRTMRGCYEIVGVMGG
jgi:hypothetical protein